MSEKKYINFSIRIEAKPFGSREELLNAIEAAVTDAVEKELENAEQTSKIWRDLKSAILHG